MASECWTYVVYVNKPYAWLGDDQWIGRRGYNAVCDVGLEVYDACAGEVEVVSPSGDNWVRLDSLMAMPFKEGEESLPHFRKSKTFAGWWIVYECEGCATVRCGFSTGCLVWVLGPEIAFADWAQLSNVSAFVEEGNVILAFWKSFQALSLQMCSETMRLQRFKFEDKHKDFQSLK